MNVLPRPVAGNKLTLPLIVVKVSGWITIDGGCVEAGVGVPFVLRCLVEVMVIKGRPLMGLLLSLIELLELLVGAGALVWLLPVGAYAKIVVVLKK